MKQFKHLSLIIIIVIISSCNKSVTDSKEYTLVGKWTFSSATFERLLTTNSAQTVKIPYSGVDRIVVSGRINKVLNRLVYNSTEPQTIYAINVEYDLYMYDVLSIDVDSKMGTLISPLVEKTYTGQIDFTYNGETLVINNSEMSNQNDSNDVINIEGEISFETVDIPANSSTSIALPAVISTYPPRFMQYEFREDGTFLQTVNDNDGSVTSLGTWESTGNTITTTLTDGDNTEIHTIEYSIEGNILKGTEEYDLCQSDEECLGSYENHYQIEEGSLDSVKMISSIVFRAITEI